MMSLKVLLLLICAAVAISSARLRKQRKWTSLKVHFSVNPFSHYFYQDMPRHLNQLTKSDWINLSGEDCKNGGKYNGFRYTEKLEKGMALLFDIQGTIAGIQQILNKGELLSNANNLFRYEKVPQYNPDVLNGENVYVVTAYFVDPATICTTGRTEADLAANGTGTLLHIQGATPSDILVMPRNRTQAISEGWSENKCFVGMGYHNFYKVGEMASTNCLEIVPFFGLYDDKGDQLGFGFASYGTSASNHYEHPPAGAVSLIVGPTVPQCLLDGATNPGLSTMHVFFNEYPNLYACVL